MSDENGLYSRPMTDGLMNFISGLGTAKARNPGSALGADRRLDRTELENIYRFYWIAKAVDIKPWDMTREWRTFTCPDIDDDKIKQIAAYEKKIKAAEANRLALQWASLYGGGGIVMHVDGHGKLDEELDYTKIQKDQLKRLSPVDRWELIESHQIEYNPLSENYGHAEWYRVANDTTAQQIHHTRIIFYRGRPMPIRITRRLRGWGESDIQRWYQAIMQHETLSSAIIEGVHQANIDVVSAKGLTNLLGQDGGDQKAIDRFMVMDMCKSMLNMSIIDSEDTFTRNAFPFSGLPEIKRIYMEELSAAFDIPATRFLGSSPGGMNATGESDIRNYYDMIKAIQINTLSPRTDQLDEVMIRSALGEIPECLEYEWNSLWQMTPEEEANLQSTQATTLTNLHALGVDEFALQKDAVELGLVRNLTIEDIDAMEKEHDLGEDEDFDDDPEGVASSKAPKKSKGIKKVKEQQSFNRVSSSGRAYRETPAGNRVYKDGATD